VAGLAHCQDADDLLSLFFHTLGFLVERYRSFMPSPLAAQDVLVRSSELAHSLRDAGFLDDVALPVLTEFLEHEPATWGLSRQRHEDGSWTWKVHSYIRKFRGITTVNAYLERVDELLSPEAFLTHPIFVQESSTTQAEPFTVNVRDAIFLVHGHDDGLKSDAARLLERITDLKIVILHEQADQGQTIIEKFERHAAHAAFAVVLLTPDDAVMSEGTLLERRARQNVVLELGYFLGALGRERVCALYREGVVLPSDYSGMLYTEVDRAGAWRMKLARELRASGVTVDLGRIPL